MSIVKELLVKFQAVNEISHGKLDATQGILYDYEDDDKDPAHVEDDDGNPSLSKDGKAHAEKMASRGGSLLLQHAIKAKKVIDDAPDKKGWVPRDADGKEIKLSDREKRIAKVNIKAKTPYIGHVKGGGSTKAGLWHDAGKVKAEKDVVQKLVDKNKDKKIDREEARYLASKYGVPTAEIRNAITDDKDPPKKYKHGHGGPLPLKLDTSNVD